MLAASGTLFAVTGLCLLMNGPFNWSKFFVLGTYVFIASVIIWGGLAHFGAMRIEWLVIDLTYKTYKGRRGLLCWTEPLRGRLDDFDHIRLVETTADPREGSPGRALEFVWRKDLHSPFRVTHWRRPVSFNLERCWGELDQRSVVRTLKAIAQNTGVPVHIPKKYLDGLGLFDTEMGR